MISFIVFRCSRRIFIDLLIPIDIQVSRSRSKVKSILTCWRREHKCFTNIWVFSAHEPKAQVHYCDHALSVIRRPLSLTFNIFDFSETAERNSTKLDRKQHLNVLYQVCVFQADRKNKMAALASDWLRHFRLLWNCWTEFNETS